MSVALSTSRRTHRPGRLVLLCLLLAASALAVPLNAVPASGALGDPSVDQCFSGAVLAGCTTAAPNFAGMDVELSPDGNQVYVLSKAPPAIRVFDRGAFNKLTPRPGPSGCYNDTGADSCTIVPNFGGSWDMTLSADGTSVYIASVSNLISMVRSPATGALSVSTCYGPDAGCLAVPPLNTAYAVAASPDGKNVYVRGTGRMIVFDRNTLTGLLTVKIGTDGCFSEVPAAGCTDAVGLLEQGFEMAFSPDGRFLYYPVQSPGGIGFFIRGSDGTLSQLIGTHGGCITTNGSSTLAGECATLPAPTGDAMANSWAATVSPSGRHVFISGSDGTVVFSRAADTGKLTKTDCVSPFAIPGCQQKHGSAGMGVEVSPEGTRAIVASDDVAGAGFYGFNETTGQLTQLASPLGCFSGNATLGCTAVPGGVQYGKAAWAPDGFNVYLSANGPLINASVDAAPVCQAVSATVPHDTPTKIQLACTDPNGDAVTINAPAQSAAGQLSAVDQSTDTVLYSPSAGFAGADSFTYAATANGVTSSPATVSLTVQAAAAAAPDTFVTLIIGTKVLRLNDKHKAKVKLTCPTTEKSGPCTGTLKVKTRGKVPVNGKKRVVVLATAKFSIAAGVTKLARLRLSDKSFALVKKVSEARKVRLVAKVKDAVGNTATVKRRGKLTLP